MRLLLLLSAILSALTGVAGPRAATAQAVAASSPAVGQVARAQAGAVLVAQVFAPAPTVGDALTHRSRSTTFALPRAYPLYADRLRE